DLEYELKDDSPVEIKIKTTSDEPEEEVIESHMIHLLKCRCLFFNGVNHMRLDKELIRDILINIHKYKDTPITDEQIKYHLYIMEDGELIRTNKLQDGNETIYIQLDMSSEGYELLTHISNSYVWDSIKERLQERDMTVNDVPMDIIKWLSQETMKDMFGG